MLDVILILLWIAWGTQAVLSAMQVRKYARRFERPRRAGFDAYRPRVAVIVPFKGLEPGLEANIHGLLEQDYPDYRLVFVVESEQDPAYPILRRETARYIHRRAEVIVAGFADGAQGQKVHNQLAAIAHLKQQDEGEAVWVFADSDAVPGPGWLGDLVGPLVQADKTAVTTGYRWLVPEPDEAGRVTLWSRLASVVNSSVACFMGRDAFNQAWGGSMAVRVETAERGGLTEMLRGSITDDYPMTKLAKDLGLRVYFVPGCLVPSPVTLRLGEMVNFGQRQYLITRVHAAPLYWAALGLLSLYLLGFVTAWAALLVELIARPGELRWLIPLLAIVVVMVAEWVRADMRERVVRHAFGEAMLARLRGTLWLDRWLTPVWMAVHWLLVVRGGIGRRMRWRGNLYHLRGPHDIEKLPG